jgi:outer membrane lipoprotein-sorting protein
MLKKSTVLILIYITFMSTGLMARPRTIELMKRIEEIQTMTADIRAKVNLIQTKTGQGTKKIEMIYYRRDSDDAFLIVLTAPETDSGNGYLRVGDNFWMYRLNTRTFQHINRDENISGTNAHAEDFERRKLTELYEPARDKSGNEIVLEEKLGSVPVYSFSIKAKVNNVDYPNKTFWVHKENGLPLKMRAYSSSGTLMQTYYYMNYTIIEGRYVSVKQLFIDEFEKGNKTLVEISGISTKKLENSIFTKAYLENLSK